jgi:hypothetical protein
LASSFKKKTLIENMQELKLMMDQSDQMELSLFVSLPSSRLARANSHFGSSLALG